MRVWKPIFTGRSAMPSSRLPQVQTSKLLLQRLSLTMPACYPACGECFAAVPDSLNVAFASFAGIQSVNVDPFPGSLERSSSPPRSRLNRREIARPKPVPRLGESHGYSDSRVYDLNRKPRRRISRCSCNNRWKTLSQ